ncbi:MAG: hypothetical protein WA902_24010 [Thermosynechococcaceae cyanobacterium]
MPTLSDQEIRSLIQITHPEVIYSAQGQVKGEALLTRCRNDATNYKAAIENIKAAQGGVILDTQIHVCKEAAHAAVLGIVTTEHLHVTETTKAQKASLKSIFDAAGTQSAKFVCNLLDSASDNLKRIAKIEDSREKLLRFNNVYRGQKRMTIELLKLRDAHPVLIAEVEQLHKPQSTKTLSTIWQKLTNWDESETLKLLKKANAFATLTEF